jgi:hypothetical protein
MIRFSFRAALGMAALALSTACAGHQAPGPSKITTPYQAKVDDAVRESASVVLVTTRDVVIGQDCNAANSPDAGALDRLVAAGTAARLPANVTIYAMPFDPITPDSLPEVVTDDGFGGRLCTPHSFSIPNPPSAQPS